VVEPVNSTDLEFRNMCANESGLDRKIVFTGSKNFQVREIEVFEITE
jgi:hypothetical protein